MSFSSEIKSEIMSANYRGACCRRSLLYGALTVKGICNNGRDITLSVDGVQTAEFLGGFIKEFFGKEAGVSSSAVGGRCKILSFDSKAVGAYLLGLDSSFKLPKPKCQYCQSAFIRGVFLCAGRLTDPNKSFCLEFSIKNKEDIITEYFDSNGIELKSTTRRSESLLYTKNSTAIEDFLALAELNDAAFEVMNLKIARALKNDANRLRNFDTVNISKAVDAANYQYTLIHSLYEKNLLSNLPDELVSTAKMRLENPEMSLSQLAMHSVPPLTKSGVSHRMANIVKLAEEILKKHV